MNSYSYFTLFLQRLRESSSETLTTPPKVQKLERLQTIEIEHKNALERAVSLNIPHAVINPEEVPSHENGPEPSESHSEDALETKSVPISGTSNWDEVVEKLFNKDESGELHLKSEAKALK